MGQSTPPPNLSTEVRHNAALSASISRHRRCWEHSGCEREGATVMRPVALEYLGAMSSIEAHVLQGLTAL
jgi:hypothetical protein